MRLLSSQSARIASAHGGAAVAAPLESDERCDERGEQRRDASGRRL